MELETYSFDLAAARARMRSLHRAAEQDVLRPLLEHSRLDAAAQRRVQARASGLIADLRAAQSTGWINQFLREYGLNSSEGIALLSLAEAFLRVPDSRTADSLIADKLGGADWLAHTGKSRSFLVNSATWGLVLGQGLVADAETRTVVRQLISRAGEPFVRRAIGAAMQLMGQVFVMGSTIEKALKRVARRDTAAFTASFDMLGEAARTWSDASRYFDAYAHAIAAIGRAGNRGHSISIKLSALHPRFEVAQYDRCVPSLVEQLDALATAAMVAGISITVDAEESERLEMSLDIIEQVAKLPALSGWDGIGMAVQAYGKRALPIIHWGDALGAGTGRRIAVRLVKGAYWDSEVKRAQERGLADYPVFTRKAATDVSYLACARGMLRARHIYPAFATHNALTVATILEWAGSDRDFEFQRLHGMGEGLYDGLVRNLGYKARIYAPVGGHSDLLAYLVRRLLENGANSSFVHQLANERLSETELLADPVARIEAVGATRHPAVPLPADLFGSDRKNNQGLDLDDREELDRLARLVADPLDPMTAASAGDAPAMVQRALAAFPLWNGTSVDDRAACLERLAALLEEERDALMRLCVQEARKTIPDALGEVREAVDFCRYYAAQARKGLRDIELPGPTGERNLLRMSGRGVWICIAPWNFPLAIFLGQVAAALVTGNSVVAKPAPQTPAIAAYAIALAHRAGIPRDALILAVGGPETGAALVADMRIAGVAFTGSTATAKHVARELLKEDERPLIPMIAETGGINAMIVDSTALTEQVVRDVIESGFRSAGQRCSALRLLVLQEEIADRTVEMLAGAMDMLVVGDPAKPCTDVGPVIDEVAYEQLMRYRSEARPRWLKTIEVPEQGLFVPPTLIDIAQIRDMRREWFGPLVHVARWKAGRLGEMVEQVNRLGFGLTMGFHSRIARAAEMVQESAQVGNLYVNRSMIGAIVGSQPFGGEGLSGTGPKAGGPNYLFRFCVERVTSTDTTAAGGNATLLSLEDAEL